MRAREFEEKQMGDDMADVIRQFHFPTQNVPEADMMRLEHINKECSFGDFDTFYEVAQKLRACLEWH